MGTVNTDDKGNYTFLLNAEKHNVRAEKEAYTTKEESVTTTKTENKLDIALEKEGKVTIGDDLGKCFGIKIYTLISINPISV
jgi:hypothetical protein